MNALKMKWGLCSHFNPLISFLGKKKLRKPNYIFNSKMVNLFQYKTNIADKLESHRKMALTHHRSINLLTKKQWRQENHFIKQRVI